MPTLSLFTEDWMIKYRWISVRSSFFASTNPQYDDRLLIELHVQYMKISSSNLENMLCTEIVSDIQNNFCTQNVLPMFCNKKSFWQRFTCTNKIFLCLGGSMNDGIPNQPDPFPITADVLLNFTVYVEVDEANSRWFSVTRFDFKGA